MFDRRVSIIAARDSRGRILLQLRDHTAKARRGCWAFFGGHIHGGETPEQTAMREAEEELGLHPKLRFIRRYEQMEDAGLYEKFLFIFHIDLSPEELKTRLQEGESAGFFSGEELKHLKIDERDREIINEILTLP